MSPQTGSKTGLLCTKAKQWTHLAVYNDLTRGNECRILRWLNMSKCSFISLSTRSHLPLTINLWGSLQNNKKDAISVSLIPTIKNIVISKITFWISKAYEFSLFFLGPSLEIHVYIGYRNILLSFTCGTSLRLTLMEESWDPRKSIEEYETGQFPQVHWQASQPKDTIKSILPSNEIQYIL